MSNQRRTARWRKRRVIYNNDGDDVFEIPRRKKELIDDFLDVRSTPLLGSHVDSVFYSSCAAGMAFTHNTKVGHFINTEAPKELIELYGKDDLQIQIDFCRKNGLEIFWSLRMNDGHDAYPVGSGRWTTGGWHIAPFKRDHPEYLMGKPGDWEKYGWGPRKIWTYLNYGYAEVREYVFSLFKEVCEQYDVDGIELDFFRAPVFFTPSLDNLPVEQEHRDTMTELIRRIRDMTEEVGQSRNKPLLIAARVPENIDYAEHIGVDLKRLLKEDLLDILIVGHGDKPLSAPFKQMVEMGHKHDVPAYPCISHGFWHFWAWLDKKLDIPWRGHDSWVEARTTGKIKGATVTVNSWSGQVEAMRGAAMNIWGSGADGIYLFNFFPPLFTKHYEVLKEIGDPEVLSRLSKIYGVEGFECNCSQGKEKEEAPTWECKVQRVLSFPHGPSNIWKGSNMRVKFSVGEDVSSIPPSEVRLRLYLEGGEATDGVPMVRLNDTVLNQHDLAVTRQTALGRWLECSIVSPYIKQGDNEIEVKLNAQPCSAETTTVLGALQLLVGHKM